MTVMAENGPWTLPRDNNELHARYGAFIMKVVSRHNKVGRNFQELFQEVWLRLVRVDILSKFWDHAQTQLPKTLTAENACAYLGINFGMWRTAMWAYHNQGRAGAHWMPEPVNREEFGLTSRRAIYEFSDIQKIEDHVSGNCASDEKPWFKSTGIASLPEKKPSKAHFENYLSVMIQNTLANCFRTNKRRHKERAFDTFDQSPTQMDDPRAIPTMDLPGILSAVVPEVRMRFETVAVAPEVHARLEQARRKIRDALTASIQDIEGVSVDTFETQLFEKMEEGYTLVEAINKLDVSNRHKSRISRVVQRTLHG